MLAVIQFDSVSLPLLERLLDEGRLPVLADLRARGQWLRLATSDGDLGAAVYHTLYSGIDAGEHGLYHTFQWCAGEQRLRYMAALPKPDTVWERVGRAGGRALVIDPYVHWRPATMSGVCLSGWQFSNRIILRRWSVPASAGEELRRRFGGAPVIEETLGAPTVASVRSLARRLCDGLPRVVAAATELLRRESFDLCWIALLAAHFAGHWTWDLGTILGESAARTHRLDDILAGVYEAVDAALGRIVAALPAGADVVVASPTGIGANRSRSDFLPGMLGAILAPPGTAADRRGSAIWRSRARLPKSVRRAFSRAMPARLNYRIVESLYLHGIDWRTTRAFALPGETEGLVRVNLRGRECHGIVDRADLGALLDEIADGLASFRDPDGAPAVEGVLRLADRWPAGRSLDRLPDLLVRWAGRPSSGIDRLASPRFGEVVRKGVGTGWPGNHVDEAWAVLLPARARLVEPRRPAQLVDLAATACALSGADLGGLAGEPLLRRA